MIEGTAVAASVGRIRAGVFHLETGIVGVPLTADVGIVTTTVHGSDVILAPYAVEHLGILASVVKIVSAIVEIEAAIGYLEVFEELAIALFSI
jgi:hypothetical protein